MSLDFMQPHRRFNPLTNRYVQVSPHRLERPWQGEESDPESPVPSYDKGCYLCPGNTRKSGKVNPDYAGVYVFDNDFPALMENCAEASADDPLFRAHATPGKCRVMCFSPDHSKSLPQLLIEQLVDIVDAWAEQTQELGQRFANVQIFENKGAMMGCSNPHPHCQIWATSHVPDEVRIADEAQDAYQRKHGRRLLIDVAERELVEGERLVECNEDWLVVVPFWASWPFETLLLPRFPLSRIPKATSGQRLSLAKILKALTTRYDSLFQTSFPYSMGWHQAPFYRRGHTAPQHEHFQLHAHFYPPLLRSASVRKFMVGYEMLGEPQRDLLPEHAAEALRSVSGLVHYSELEKEEA